MERLAPISSLLGLALAAASCVQPTVVDPSDKPCPCAAGYVCDEAADRCVLIGGGGGGDGGVATDGGGGGDAGPGTDGGPVADGGPMPTADRIDLEAEDGTVEAPMMVLTDAAASGGSYVMTDPATVAATDAAPATGKVTLSFTTAADGTYRLWGRAITVMDSGDSFWVRVDGGTWVKWNTIGPFAAWDWARLTDLDNMVDPYDLTLTAGDHTLDIAYREIGAQIDKIVLTNDLAFVPSGTGG
jgi:hypothetical protein